MVRRRRVSHKAGGKDTGYYPASLFTMLNGGACASAWYGEAFNPNPPTRIQTGMGSGQHGSAGALLAAYVRNLQYLDFYYWFGVEPYDDLLTTAMQPERLKCYSRTVLTDGYTFLGGDGGKNLDCIWPSPP
jgi:hypothetical protein